MHRMLVGLVVVGLCFGAWTRANAQPNRSTPTADKTNIFRTAPRDLALALTRAKKAIAEERFSDAVSELGRLLSELDQNQPGAEQQPQDFFLAATASENGTHTSLKTEAQRLLGSMPSKGREWYELQYGAQARAMLESAVSKRDVDELADASRRFFHTKAGYEATLLLGRYHLDHGHSLAAALCFKRLAESPVAGEYEPELSVLLATCWYLAHSNDKAEQALDTLAKAGPRRKLRIGSAEVELSPTRRELKWLEDTLGRPPRALQSSENEWIMFRGNAARNATSRGDFPLATPNWRVHTANNPHDEKLIDSATKQFVSQSVGAVPALQPLAVDDVILMRTPEKLLAVDFRTGKRIWGFPWDDNTNDDQGPRANGPAANKSSRPRELSQRIWEDNPYGQLSSDGAFVYLLDDLGFAQIGNSPFGPQIIVQVGGQPQRNRNQPKSHNQLVALEIKTQGKIQWQVGDQDGQDERALAGAFFLGPPLPIMGQLYVLAEFSGEIRLVVLNAKTGQLEWQQQVAHLDNRLIANDPMRRLSGATPSFADGIVICPTASGAVVAVDIATRTLLWGYQYANITPEARQGFRGIVSVPTRSYGSRWLDSSATVCNGRVVVTPAESDELHCVDLLTGKLAWPVIRRDDHLFVGAVHGNTILLVGKNKLTAIDLVTGKPAWEKSLELPDGALVSGRGFVQGDDYYFPTTAAQIVRVDLLKGQIQSAVNTDGVLGNLICYQDQIVSHGSRFLSAYHSIPALRIRVKERLEQHESDAWALARLAELQLYDGQLLDGLTTLRKAQTLEPDDDAIRALLVRTLLDLIRTDYAQHEALANEIEKLIDQPRQRLEYLRATAAGLQQLGRHAAAFDAYLQLALIDAQSALDPSNASTQREQVGKNLTVRHERWVYARLRGLYRQASEADRAAMDGTIRGQWSKSQATGGEQAFRRFVNYFGFHPLGDQARLALARLLIVGDDFLEAEQLLARLESSADRQVAVQATAELAGLFVHTKQFELAGQYLRKLKDLYGDAALLDGRSGLAVHDEALRGDQAELLMPRRWKNGRTEITEASDSTGRYLHNTPNQIVNLIDVRGPVATGTHVVADTQRSLLVSVRDGQGQELVQANVARTDGRAFYPTNVMTAHQARLHGHLIMAQIGTEVFAISALRSLKRAGDPVLWREDLAQMGDSELPAMRMQSRPVNNPWDDPRITLTESSGRPVGQLGPLTLHGQIYQRGRELTCVDPLTGEFLWMRNDVDLGSELFGDDELLFVALANSDEALVLDPLDGSELGRRKIVKAEERWTTRGRNILTWSQSEGRLKLRLFDAWTGGDLLIRDCALGSKGCRLANEEVAVLQPDGSLLIASLDSGELRVSTTVEPCSSLSQVRVLRSSEYYHVIANAPLPNSKANVQTISLPGASLFLAHAAIYAFDRATGKSVWQTPAIIEQHTLTLDQPSEVPVITFFQQLRGNAPQASLLCIDKRDGRIVFQLGELPGSLSPDVDGDLAQQTVTVSTPVKSVTIRFTDEPAPPEPPAQTGSASTAGLSRAASFFGSIARLGKNLLGEGDESSKKNGDPFADP